MTREFSTAFDLSFNLEVLAKKLNIKCNVVD